MIAAVMAWLLGKLAQPRVLLALTAVAGLLIAWQWARSGGWNSAMDHIDKQDEKALSDAEIAEFDHDECVRRDGVFYDFVTGKCRRGSPGD